MNQKLYGFLVLRLHFNHGHVKLYPSADKATFRNPHTVPQ